jgi:acetylornithine deacetylase/succinyl-diaminopimelate desuccinylase-like protein
MNLNRTELGHLLTFSRTASGMLCLGGALFLANPSLIAQDNLLQRPDVKAAFQYLDRDFDRFVSELVTLTEIPAPSFKETARAAAMSAKFSLLGLKDVHIDQEGNVLGMRSGTGGGPLLALAAHLDTVFPEGTDVHVRKEGTKYSAPGIGDDTHGLASLLAIIRALDSAHIVTRSDILFVADVGEEGLGNSRGIHYLLEKGEYREKVKNFISIDGSDDNSITNGGVASKRYRVTFKGPGGHSYGAFGLVSPAFAMGDAMTRLSHSEVPHSPKTTFNVGVVGGGTSVNSIPGSVWMEVDMRSESPAELDNLEKKFLADVAAAVETENKTRSTRNGAIAAETQLVGDRKGGKTPEDTPLVRAAMEVTRGLGGTPDLRYSSTDSNVPIGMGIPAITIGAGRAGQRAHSPDEFAIMEKSATVPGQQRALAIVLAVAGVKL